MLNPYHIYNTGPYNALLCNTRRQLCLYVHVFYIRRWGCRLFPVTCWLLPLCFNVFHGLYAAIKCVFTVKHLLPLLKSASFNTGRPETLTSQPEATVWSKCYKINSLVHRWWNLFQLEKNQPCCRARNEKPPLSTSLPTVSKSIKGFSW